MMEIVIFFAVLSACILSEFIWIGKHLEGNNSKKRNDKGNPLEK